MMIFSIQIHTFSYYISYYYYSLLVEIKKKFYSDKHDFDIIIYT